MNQEFPIAVKLRNQENYTLFLSDGDSINLVIENNFIYKLYRNHTGMQEYETLILALCEIHEVVSSKKFDEIFERYYKQEMDFLDKDRPVKMLTSEQELEKAIPKSEKKKKEKTIEMDFGE